MARAGDVEEEEAVERSRIKATTTSSSGSSSSKSKSKHVSRVTFTEVTKNAVLEAFGKPRRLIYG